ncbi:hypothetical protein EI555_011442, partial [Monodon monoceros]
MTDLSSSSFFSDLGLLLYLEELNKEELNRFKSLLKNETTEPGSCRIPWSEVKKAKQEDLANLMNKYHPGEQAWGVALKIFGKMNLKDLCERANAEINWTAQTDTRGHWGQRGDGAEYRVQIREKFCIMLDKNYLLGESETFCHEIAQEGRELLERLFDEDVRTAWNQSCDLTTVCCRNISKVLIRSQSLLSLNPSTNNLLDDRVKMLCEALMHPKCNLERLSLESCGLTVAGCEDLSLALISNKRLTRLCLVDSVLGDSGVKLMSDALKQPECTLQSLVLRHCHFTSPSSESLSTSLLCNKSLTHLDLGSNCLQNDGVKLLCDVFRHPSCSLQDLELMGCVLISACCLDLSSAILNNPNLKSLDLGNNDLQDDGVGILFEALRHPNCNIQRL